MTETVPGASFTEDGIAEGEAALPRAQRRMAPIVPAQNVAGRALISVIAIMTFLSCLTLGAVTLVRDTAAVWESQISREATIQIKPVEGLDMEAALETAAAIASGFPGITGARIVDREATARLLEPWLGAGLNIDELPVPRLIIVTINEAYPPDFGRLRVANTTDNTVAVSISASAAMPIVTVVRAMITSRSTHVRWSSSAACGTSAVTASRSRPKSGG